MLVAVITIQVWTSRDFSARQAVKNGFGWGLSLLVSWSFAPLYVAMLLTGIFVAGRARLARYAVFVAVTTGCMMICIAPWVYRNWRVFGTFIPGRTNTGIELRISNNDLAASRESANYKNGVYHRYHPLQSVAEVQKLLELGEVEYDRQLQDEARTWIATHPARFARLTTGRFGLYWFFPDRKHVLKTVILWVRTLLAMAGLIMTWRIGLVSARVSTVILLILPLPNYLVHVSLKHSYPLEWSLVLLASVVIARMVQTLHTGIAAL